MGTILDIEDKTKDTIKARLDLERMGIRRGLWMNRDSDKARRDLAFFSMKPNDKKQFLKFVSSVKFPDEYASNITRCVNVDGGKFAGLKSHDCHVFMQCLLHVGIQHLLPEDVVKPIMLLSRFFSQLTAKTLLKTDINQLRHDIVHKYSLQLSSQASRRAEKKCTQQGEARMINLEAWVQYDLLTFCGMYLKDVETGFNRPQRNNDGGVRNEKLSIFAQSARPFGDPVRGESFSRNDIEVAHWFVLNNCDEIMKYLDEHEDIMKREHPSHLYAKKQLFLTFRYKRYCSSPLPPKFQNSSPSPLLLFIRPVFGLPSPPPATPSDDMCIKRTSTLSSTSFTSQPMPTAVWIAEKSKKLAGFYPKSPSLVRANKLKSSNSPTYSEKLINLAFGPIHAELFSGCHVNGVKFLGTARDNKLCMQNSCGHVPGGGESTNIDFYGKLTTIVQLLYKD
ncbi:unnamed protein product [Prunus armeniaca]